MVQFFTILQKKHGEILVILLIVVSTNYLKCACSLFVVLLLREGPCENHANGSTMHLSDFPQIWHTCATSLVHIPCGTVWLNCLLFRRNVNQTVTSTNVLKFEAKFTPNLITSYKHNMGRNEISYLLTVVVTLNKRPVYSKLLSVNSFV